MLDKIRLLALALIAPLLLTSCFYEPGKFDSTLTVLADRSFVFTYTGEVIAKDPSQSMGSTTPSEGEATEGESSEPKPDPAEAAKKKAEKDAEYRAVAEALAKEHGFTRAEYVGDGVFMVDYRITGKLGHSFIFPLNIDAKMIIPFVAIELRGADRLRVMAPGFAESSESQQGGGMLPSQGQSGSRLDGHFTLVTDAEIVSQNNEEGASEVGGRKTIKWRATPLTKDAPMAVLRVAALP